MLIALKGFALIEVERTKERNGLIMPEFIKGLRAEHYATWDSQIDVGRVISIHPNKLGVNPGDRIVWNKNVGVKIPYYPNLHRIAENSILGIIDE